MIVQLQGNIDDDPRDLLTLLGELAEIHATRTTRSWQLRCRQCRYLGPWSAAVLHAAFLEGTRLGQRPTIQLPDEPEALRAYCLYSGMVRAFANGPAPNPDHPECETIPLTAFSSASWNLADGIVKLVDRHAGLPPDAEDKLRTCIQEVTQNVVDHARSQIGGVMSAKYFTGTGEVRVGIVDRGVGIAESLGGRFPELASPFEALSRVIKGGYSSRSRPNNMGLGVSNLFGMIQSSGGVMTLVSADAAASIRPKGGPNVQTLPFSFPGTGVFFTLPLRESAAT
jgi:hypothetical protein